MLESEFSEVIRGVITGVHSDHDEEPLKKIPHSHKVFILDPRRTQHQLAKGFEEGFSMSQAIEGVSGVEHDGPIARLGGVVLRRTQFLMVPVISKKIDDEIRAAKAVMARAGARGFKSRGVRNSAGAVLFLGGLSPSFARPEGMSPEGAQKKRQEIVEAVELGLAMQSTVDLRQIRFGPLEVNSRRAQN